MMKTKSAIAGGLMLFSLLVVSCRAAAPSSAEIQNEAEAAVIPSETPAIVGSQTVNGVTLTINWFLADARRVSFGYTIEGLPDVPDATYLFGQVQLAERSGTGELGWGGDAAVSRVPGSPGTLVGSWSSVFAKPFTQPRGQFVLDITLGNDRPDYNTNFTIASFPIPADATAYPPNVFPPKLPDGKVADFNFEFETEVYPLLTLTPAQTITANNIEMRLERLEITTSFTTATLCYSKPSSKDWMTGRSTLKTVEGEENENAYSLLFDSGYGTYGGDAPVSDDALQMPSGRCVQVEFFLGHSNQPGTVTLTVPMLEQSIPEVIPDDELAAAREKLLPQGIDVGWEVVSDPTGGGSSGPVYNKLPEGMTRQEAYQLFIEALGYIYPGPWEFTVEVNP
jgi:hypothetical protein